jgi:3-oxoacyl-[acyl-carrier-protein] synthase II
MSGAKMNRIVLLFSMGCVLLLSATAPAATHFVDVNNASPASPYTSWSTAATNIQDAVDAAAVGDVVLVTNGVYQSGGGVVYGMSNRVAVTKPMTLMSVNGPGATLIVGYQVPGTTNGDPAVRCVYITNGALLSGFTLTNGATRAMGDYYTLRSGGGVWCESTDAVVSNCVVVANACISQGAGAMNGTFYQCAFLSNNGVNFASGGGAANASLNDCMLSGNSAGYQGGGAYLCTLNRSTLQGNLSLQYAGGAYGGTLSNCALIGNWASAMGGGAYGGYSDSCTLVSCTLSGNSSGFEGGGAFFCTANGCVFTGNSSMFGGGAERGTLNNCTFTGNSAAIGGGVDYAALNNCVLFYNRARSYADNYSDSTLNYCCTTPLPSTGTGNRADEPHLASDSHLSATSPCRGSGSAAYAAGTDIDGEAWANPPAIGCDEYRSGSLTGPLNVTISVAYTNVSVGFSVYLHALIGGRVSASRWSFGDGTVISNCPYASHAWLTPGTYTVESRAFNEGYPGGVAQVVNIQVVPQPVHYVSMTSGSPAVPYTSWETAATNIQDGVDVAIPGALVLVTNGTYQTGGRMIYGSSNRVALTTPVTLKSVNGPAVTTIAGLNTLGTTNEYAAVRCVYLTNGATVAGFTLTNGSTTSLNNLDQDDSGGGVWCEWVDCTISNCVLAGNSASYIGGGAYSGTLRRCVLAGNSGNYGGGASGSIMSSCVLKQNSAAYGGGSDHVDGGAHPQRIGIYLGSALGGIAYAEEQHERYMAKGIRQVAPNLALAVFGGAAPANLGIALDVRGPILSTANSCASGAVAIGEAVGAIRAGEIDAAIAGGVEIPLSPLAFGAFDIIRALSAGSNDDPAHACRPFDARRDGFVMGEGAALLVLESDEIVRTRGVEPYAEVMGYGATSDAHHMVQPRADGTEAARAATIALADAGVEADAIDYVNAHASSTPIGDVAEARAIALALGERAATVPVSGTKALYGHPLGASGAIEAAICALAIRDGWVPASANLETVDPEVGAILPGLLRTGRDGTYRRILSTSFGFGGLNAGLVIGAIGG